MEEKRFVPLDVVMNGLGVGSSRSWTATKLAGRNLTRPVDVKPVALSRLAVGKVPMPARAGHFGQIRLSLVASAVENSQHHALSDLCNDGNWIPFRRRDIKWVEDAGTEFHWVASSVLGCL